MPRNPAALPLPGRLRRSEEEIRQLRLRLSGDEAPGDWQLLEPYLTPGWSVPVNTSVSDLSDPHCPRYYVDRDRVYLGGVVQLTRSALGPYVDDTILDLIPAALGPSRYLVTLGPIAEDFYWTETGWLPHTGIVWGAGTKTLQIVTGGVDDEIDDGVAISLEPISWRLGG